MKKLFAIVSIMTLLTACAGQGSVGIDTNAGVDGSVKSGSAVDANVKGKATVNSNLEGSIDDRDDSADSNDSDDDGNGSISAEAVLRTTVSSYLNANYPNVTANVNGNGSVTLNGTVSSETEKDAAVRGVSSLSGVTSVTSNLSVK